MKDFVDFVKTHNVWLASVFRVGLSVLAAFGFQLTSEQMALLVTFVEVVFGVGQAKANISEPRVDTIVANRVSDIMMEPPK
jgi:hypothetical protein